MKGSYVAVITPVSSKRFECRIPDFPGCITSGRTLEEAGEMIEDAANLWAYGTESDGREVPLPSSYNSIEHQPSDLLQIVRVDTEAYQRQNNNRAVRKNVSLPAWMADKADKAGINCSKVLQESLTVLLSK